jgi:hypothetical protein
LARRRRDVFHRRPEECRGIEDQDLRRSVRYGVTMSVPLATRWSAKLAWSRGLITRVGGDFQVFSVALQYRWFNR